MMFNIAGFLWFAHFWQQQNFGANGGGFPVTTNVTVNSGGSISTTGTGTINVGGYTGVSPKDCSTASCNTPGVGAKGDWHTFFDCTISAGQAVENCTGSHFTSTAVDGGKAAELECNNAITVTTILSVQSGTQATLATTCAVTQTNTAFGFGTDDTTALRNWAAFISAAFVSTSTTPTVRAGYVPRGLYYHTNAIRFIGPAIVAGLANNWECAKIAAGTIGCPLYLQGTGTWSSMFVGSSNFNWAADGASTNTGECYFKNWSGSYIWGLGCGWAMQQESGYSTNTTGQTGLVGPWVFDNNNHTTWTDNFAAGATCTGGPVCGGLVIDKDFESSYSDGALEFNDLNLYINPSGAANLYEKIVFDTLFCEGGGGANGNIQLNQGAYKQVTFRNIHSRDGTNSVNIRNSVMTTNGDALVFERFRSTTSATGATGFVIQSSVKVECDDCYLEDTSGVAGNVLVTISAAAATLHFEGGGLFGTTLTNCMNLGSTSIVYALDTVITGCTNNFTGAGVLNAMIPVATGWSGPGGIGGNYFLATGAVPTLSAGTGACATTSTQVGGSWSGSFVCTGTTGASTITIAPGTTAPHAWSCSASDVTHTLVGSQSGLSATTCTMTFTSVTTSDVITFQASQY